MSPFYVWGPTVSRIQNHYEESVPFLPLGPQEYLVLIPSASKESTLCRSWNHSLVMNPGPYDWEYNILTTRPLIQLMIQRF